MYVIVAPIQIKHDHKEEFVKAMIEDAKGSVENEPGCLRFDVIQDASHSDRIWLYEVYKDEEAFKSHLESPHLKMWMETTKDWRDQGPTGAGRGSYNIWPPDGGWK